MRVLGPDGSANLWGRVCSLGCEGWRVEPVLSQENAPVVTSGPCPSMWSEVTHSELKHLFSLSLSCRV